MNSNILENEIGTDSSNNIISPENILTEEGNEIGKEFNKKEKYQVLTDEKESPLSTNINNQTLISIEKSIDKRSILCYNHERLNAQRGVSPLCETNRRRKTEGKTQC